jgi:hypothetical protein
VSRRRWLAGLAALAFALAPGPVFGQAVHDLFEQAVAAEGEEYRELRDAVIAAPGAREVLEELRGTAPTPQARGLAQAMYERIERPHDTLDRWPDRPPRYYLQLQGGYRIYEDDFWQRERHWRAYVRRPGLAFERLDKGEPLDQSLAQDVLMGVEQADEAASLLAYLLPRYPVAVSHLVERYPRVAREAVPAAIPLTRDPEGQLELALGFSRLGVYDETAVAVLRDAFEMDWTDPEAPYATDWGGQRSSIALGLGRMGDVEMARPMFVSLGTPDPWEGCCSRREVTLRAVHMLVGREVIEAWIGELAESDEPIERESAAWARANLSTLEE